MFKKVVIIDDNRTQLKILKSHFSIDEWEVLDATNTNDAIKLICLSAPDLIITDAIMPKTGGFQLLKQLREDEVLRKIPVIVYSVLTESLSRLYIKESRGEYFLTKNNTGDEIYELALKAIEENPLTKQDKLKILDKHYIEQEQQQPPKEKTEEIEKIGDKQEKQEKIEEKFVFNIDKNKLQSTLKNKYRILVDDDKMPVELASILYPYLMYNLAVFCFYDYTNKKQVLYFDIKNFIFSPILQSYFETKLNCTNSHLNKKFIPNSKTVVSVDEFNSKIELNFEYKNRSIASVAFYCLNKDIQYDKDNIQILKQVLDEFFAIRFINKNSKTVIEENISTKYSKNKIDTKLKNNFNPAKTKIGMYLGIINIANYLDIEMNSYEEDLDILNSKIAENIMTCLTDGEQIDKTEEDEYIIILLAVDDIQARKKFALIYNTLKTISINEMKPDITIGISNCYIKGNFDFNQAQKQAHIALENAQENNKMVIYAE